MSFVSIKKKVGKVGHGNKAQRVGSTVEKEQEKQSECVAPFEKAYQQKSVHVCNTLLSPSYRTPVFFSNPA